LLLQNGLYAILTNKTVAISSAVMILLNLLIYKIPSIELYFKFYWWDERFVWCLSWEGQRIDQRVWSTGVGVRTHPMSLIKMPRSCSQYRTKVMSSNHDLVFMVYEFRQYLSDW